MTEVRAEAKKFLDIPLPSMKLQRLSQLVNLIFNSVRIVGFQGVFLRVYTVVVAAVPCCRNCSLASGGTRGPYSLAPISIQNTTSPAFWRGSSGTCLNRSYLRNTTRLSYLLSVSCKSAWTYNTMWSISSVNIFKPKTNRISCLFFSKVGYVFFPLH